MKVGISFFLQKLYGKYGGGDCQIRMRVRWGGGLLVQLNSGYTIDATKWDATAQRPRRGVTGGRGVPGAEISRELGRMEDVARMVFARFGAVGVSPSVDECRAALKAALGRSDKADAAGGVSLYDVFDRFVREQSTLNSWSDATLTRFRTLRRLLSGIDAGLRMDGMTKGFFARFIDMMLSKGNRNSTVLKQWKMLKWFLRWADGQGLLECRDYAAFSPRLRTVSGHEVVFLTWDELMRVYGYEFGVREAHLSRVRDVFCFQCFTSLRYSDVARLRWDDIDGDVIKVVTAKTGDVVRIELNKWSRAILARYAGAPRPLPVLSNQKMNQYVKLVCRAAGIDTPTSRTWYQGSRRIDEVRPKWELVGTHTGRRTFICNALALGIPAATVMAWTGHSDYASMKPYIKIADDERARAMSRFDEL